MKKEKPFFLNRLNKVILILISISILLLYFNTFLKGNAKTYTERSLLSLVVIICLLILNLYIIKALDKLNLPYSKNFSNLIHVIAFFIAGMFILNFWGINTSLLTQSSVLLGLILGLALQPILSNLFAGIIILSTRYVEVGKRIKILSSQIPYGLVPMPAYKFLSVENTDLGYKGTIKKVTLFYSIFQSEEGEEIKIPNNLLLNSVILEREKENSIISIRVEFPLNLKIKLNELENKIKETLKDFEIVEGPYFNEQSDKEYVFITIKILSKDNWKKTKSEVLKKLLILKESLKRQKK
jgi:small-conductance mechanosensitive channel